jgi:probable F420-dependent oxidoreductase
MDIGIHLAQNGSLATPAAVRASAAAAETLGYRSVWVLDRLLAPLEPSCGYGGTDLPLPPAHRTSLDPLTALAFAAAVTDHVRLGTSVLVGPWYPPALLARSLTSHDVLSGGRLTVGLGLGWSPEEFAAAGLDGRDLAARQEELLDALDAWWGGDPVQFSGTRSTIAPSTVGLRPVQRPHPPVLLAAFSPAGLDRIVRRADGWMPVGLPATAIGSTFAGLRNAAAASGRDPEALRLVVRAPMVVTARDLDGDRLPYHGSVRQVVDDVDAAGRAGAHEVILAVEDDRGLDATLDAYAAIAEALELRAHRSVA